MRDSAQSELARCEKRALMLLARREHSRQELHAKLRQKGFARADIETVLDDLIEQGWLSDARFAEAFIRHRAARGYGPVRISAELHQRGVPSDAAAIGWAQSPVDWEANIQRVLQKRYTGSPDGWDEQAKRFGFLTRRGFPADLAHQYAGWWSD